MVDNQDLIRRAVIRLLGMASKAKISLLAYCQFSERLITMKNDQFGVAIAKSIISSNEIEESILAENIMRHWGRRRTV